MNQLIKIRYMEPEDWNRILEIENLNHINKEGKSDPRKLSKKQIMDFIGDKRTRLVVLDTSNGVQGFLIFNAKHEKKAIIERLSVEKKDVALQEMLLEQSITWAKKAYADKLYIYVYEEDDDAIAFFSSHGFKGKVDKKHFKIGENQYLDAIEFTRKIELNDKDK